jgi:predicted RND superfamily exporter protein
MTSQEGRKAKKAPREKSDRSRVRSIFGWIDSHIGLLSVVLIVAAVVFGIVGTLIADTDEPNFSPSGEIYDTEARAEDVFAASSPIRIAAFLVDEPNGQDVLTQVALLEFLNNSADARGDANNEDHLQGAFDQDLGTEVAGVFSLADAVDAALPSGLAGATDADVKIALADLLADDSPLGALRFTLADSATAEPGEVGGNTLTIWRSPAFLASVRYDIDTFEGGDIVDGQDLVQDTNAETWLRTVQVTLRGDQLHMRAIGLGIDSILTGDEQLEAGAPFIFLAVAIIVLLVGALLRSYWAAVVVTTALSLTLLFYNGILGFVSLNMGSALVVFILPITLIAFGVDFFIHGMGRVREAQVDGVPRSRAYTVGMVAVFSALTLAAATSAAAFLSNAASGIEAIIEFGFAAAIGLIIAYLILGWVGPKAVLHIEERVGPNPADRGLMVGYKLSFLFVAIVAGVIVSLTAMMPQFGAIALLVFLGLFVLLPMRLTRKRNTRIVEKGRPVTDEVKGAGQGFKAAGTVVHFLARWRVFTLPVVGALAIAGVYGATQVETAFVLSDFFSPKTDFIQGLERIETHYGGATGGSAFIYVEGDLTDPASIEAMEAAIARLDQSEAQFARDLDGELVVSQNAASLVRTTMTVPGASANVESVTGIAVIDSGSGLPDSAAGVGAIYTASRAEGVIGGDGVTIIRADHVETFLYEEANSQATLLQVQITTFTDDAIILEARRVLEDSATVLAADLGSAARTVSVSGDIITQQDTLAAFTGSMMISLPIAIILTVLIVGFTLRSVRYSIVTVIPILLVVAWVFGYMWLKGITINVITATIAAIAVGVGIDFSTHFTVRFREEFENEPSRFPALRRAGEGTGGALVLSAITSIIGFGVMATAPTPLFASFGELMAVMILFAVVVALLVLPSLLIVVTPRRKGEEREDLEAAITGGRYDYDPHSRATATRTPETEATEEST